MSIVPEISARTLLTPMKNAQWWFGGDYNMNLYRGCCHGCIYCDSRSECYGNDQFDTVMVKKDVLTLLEKELKSKRHTGVVMNGAMTDPYNPFEKQLEVTRGSLALLDRYGFGVGFATKGILAVRDIDLLCRIHQHSPVLCKFTSRRRTMRWQEKLNLMLRRVPGDLKRWQSCRRRGCLPVFC